MKSTSHLMNWLMKIPPWGKVEEWIRDRARKAMAVSRNATTARVVMAKEASEVIVEIEDGVREMIVEDLATLNKMVTMGIRDRMMGVDCLCPIWLSKHSGSIWRTICARLAMWCERIFLRTIGEGPVVLGTYNFDYNLAFGFSVAFLRWWFEASTCGYEARGCHTCDNRFLGFNWMSWVWLIIYRASSLAFCCFVMTFL